MCVSALLTEYQTSDEEKRAKPRAKPREDAVDLVLQVEEKAAAEVLFWKSKYEAAGVLLRQTSERERLKYERRLAEVKRGHRVDMLRMQHNAQTLSDELAKFRVAEPRVVKEATDDTAEK